MTNCSFFGTIFRNKQQFSFWYLMLIMSVGATDVTYLTKYIKSLNFILTTVLQIGFWPLMFEFGPPCWLACWFFQLFLCLFLFGTFNTCILCKWGSSLSCWTLSHLLVCLLIFSKLLVCLFFFGTFNTCFANRVPASHVGLCSRFQFSHCPGKPQARQCATHP